MKVSYLQMDSPAALVSATPVEGLRLRVIDPPDGALNLRMYRGVGEAWNWSRCADWTMEQWNEHLASNPVDTIVFEWAGEEIGYAEFLIREGDVEILNFGLLEPFIGRGLGGASLELAVRHAWTLGAVHRVWLHTCEKDHPNALRNYQRRGFVLYDTVETPDREPESPPAS